jgi:hypothetical protein
MSYEEEDTCMSYDSRYPTKTIKEFTCMSYEEEDTCMSYEEEDTCMSYDSLYPTKTIKEFGKIRLLLRGDIGETWGVEVA